MVINWGEGVLQAYIGYIGMLCGIGWGFLRVSILIFAPVGIVLLV